MIGKHDQMFEQLQRENKRLGERVTELEGHFNDLVEFLGYQCKEPGQEREASLPKQEIRVLSPTLNHRDRGRSRKERSRSRSRSRTPIRSNRKRRSRSPPPPPHGRRHRDLPGIHVAFDRDTPRWTEAEARQFAAPFGELDHVHFPDGPKQQWLFINFVNEADRDRCLAKVTAYDDDNYVDMYPGVTFTIKRKPGERN